MAYGLHSLKNLIPLVMWATNKYNLSEIVFNYLISNFYGNWCNSISDKVLVTKDKLWLGTNYRHSIGQLKNLGSDQVLNIKTQMCHLKI